MPVSRTLIKFIAICAGFFWLVTAAAAQNIAIYPGDRAEILRGSRFDFKVELPMAAEDTAFSITINGQPAQDLLRNMAQTIDNEDKLGHRAYWVRGAALAEDGDYEVAVAAGNARAVAHWRVYGGGDRRRAKNVILFIGDGLSQAHRTAARILSQGLRNGLYGGELAIDAMPHMALISTAGTDSIITDSANSMSAYATGQKTCVNAIAVLCARNRDPLSHPKVETLGELVKRKTGMGLGIVTNTEIEDATPAALVAHTRQRANYDAIAEAFLDLRPDVVLGGGAAHFLPRSAEGSKRGDDRDLIQAFKDAGYAFAASNGELVDQAAKPETRRLLGLFNRGNIDGALDRKFLKKGTVRRYPDQPDLTDQVRAALQVLSRGGDGFLLMVESGRIDKYSHSLDWERAVYDTIMLDDAVKVAKEFAGGRDDTLIIVVADHTHPVSLIGTYDDARPGTLLRDKLGVYADAGFPNYPAPDKDGYPATVDVSRRLAVVFAAYPDSCDGGRPHLGGERKPTVLGPDGKSYEANPEDCSPTATRRAGLLPFTAGSGVHSGEDVILTAMGPGSEAFFGHMPNTRVFRVIATTLGLGAAP